MEKAGLIPPEPEPAPAAVAKVEPGKGKAGRPAPRPTGADAELPANPFAPDAPAAPRPSVTEVKPARPGELVLGSDQDEDPAAYHLRLVLDQKGAAVEEATSARYEAELDPAAPRPQGRLPRLRLIGDAPRSRAPGSLSMTLASAARLRAVADDDPSTKPHRPEAWLDQDHLGSRPRAATTPRPSRPPPGPIPYRGADRVPGADVPDDLGQTRRSR